MSNLLREILKEEKATFSSFIDKLEQASGFPAADIHLTSEIVSKTKDKIKELGLDPDDTTSIELYHGLNSLAKLHDSFIRTHIGANDTTEAEVLLSLITKKVRETISKRQVWSLKHSVAKRLLVKQPPKNLMKALGYRSIESMVKREGISNLYAGMFVVEDSKWVENFVKAYATLTPSDFENRKIELNLLITSKWQKALSAQVAERRHNVILSKELGSVTVLPIDVQNTEGLTLVVMSQLFYLINELYIYGSYYKFLQVQADFGKQFAKSITDGISDVFSISGHGLNWVVALKHFSNTSYAFDVFGPHIQVEDLSFISLEEELYKMEPALHYWHGNDTLAYRGDGWIISLNLLDVAINSFNKLEIEEGSTEYLRESVRITMLQRYVETAPIESQILTQLEPSSMEHSLETEFA